MKVYLVYCEYCDYDEYSNGSMLLGVYASMDKAIAARNDFVAKEVAECIEMKCDFRQSFDDSNNPVVDKFSGGEIVEGNAYTIEEWDVH